MERASSLFAAMMAACLLLPLSLIAANTALHTQQLVYDYHAVVPLGQDALLLQPGNRAVVVLASAHSITFQGWRQVVQEDSRFLVGPDGERVAHYPRFVDFRITVSARQKSATEPALPAACPAEFTSNVNDLLLNLRFRVKIFRALRVTVLEPRVVKLIGMPPDVPYDERVYRVSFDLGEVPLEDRIILEVLSPDGERLTKFHLDM
jgi:hypothetical protein